MHDFEGLNIPLDGFDAVIFDLDGTLVDSLPVHFNAWSDALAANGAPKNILPEDVFHAMGGRPTKDIVRELNGEHNLKLDPATISLAKREAFINRLDEVDPNEEVIAFARSLKGKIPMAVASGGSRIVVEKTLQKLGLSDLFDEVITSTEVAAGKPAPDVFLKAAKELSVDPTRCLALEDAPAGIMAAQTAGMKVVAVPAPVHLH